MKRAALLLFAACAAGDDAHFEVSAQGLGLEDVAELQLSVLTDRKTVDCATVTTTCVKLQFPESRFADLTDGRGTTAKAVRFAKDAGVEVTLAPAKDLVFVIEAVSAGSELAGSSCTYVETLSAGANRVTANPITLRADAGVLSGCNPKR